MSVKFAKGFNGPINGVGEDLSEQCFKMFYLIVSGF